MCFIVNGTSSVREFLNTTSLKLYLMQTSRKQISMFTEEEFQSCQAASLVNPTQVLESDLEKKMTATSGLKCLEQLERFNHVGSWGKTFSALLIGMGGWYSKRCKLTWRLKGTKSNRMYFQLQASTLPTEGIESGLLLGTPRAQERPRSEKFREGRTPSPIEYAEQYSEMLPTPTTGADQKTQYQQGGRSLMNYLDFHGMLPTPLASEIHHPERVKKLKETGAETMASRKNGANRPNGLTDYLDFHGMLPTPTTSCANAGTDKERPIDQPSRRSELNHLMSQEAGTRSQLNPQFVEEMMGFPENWTLSPFLSGETKA